VKPIIKPRPRFALRDYQGIIRYFWSREDAERVRLPHEYIEETEIEFYQPEEAPF
jgi:hypothetical protein